MNGRLLILCPGQGCQDEGMFDLARADARAAAFIDRCAPYIDMTHMFENRAAQPLVVAATLAMWEALRERIPAPALAAGYSIGELAAYSVAGALEPEQTVALAAQRAGLMDQAAQEEQTMAALTGLPVDRAQELVRQAGFEVAIITGEDSCIAGGLLVNLAALEQAAQASGARFQRLPVAIASHTRLMAGAAASFGRILGEAGFSPQSCPVLSGVAAMRITRTQDALEHLSRQVAQTIQWSACMDAAVESGATVVLELGPGCALARMFRNRHPDLPCRSVSEFRSLDGIVNWLERQLD